MAKKKEVILHKCRECENATDWQSEALDGHLILCRCKYHKYLRFLDLNGCNVNFRPRK